MMDPVRVQEIYEANKKGEIPDDFGEKSLDTFSPSGDDELEFEEDLTGIIELPPDEKKPSRRRRRSKGRKSRGSRSGSRRNSLGRKGKRGSGSDTKYKR